MLPTYASYNLIVRNLKLTMTRVAQQSDIAREAAYYKDNIGKVRTVDDLLKNDRLYRYAMKAYGLQDMTYAKAFMRKVLESDLSDTNSFANKLVDKRYREFAAAFSFHSRDALVAQTGHQTDEMIGLYTATMKQQVEAIDGDTRYYNVMIGNITNGDQLLNDDRLRNYIYSAFGIDGSRYSRDTIRQVLFSDPSKSDSYVNTAFASRLGDIDNEIAQAQSDANDAFIKIAGYRAQLSQPGADVSDLRIKIAIESARLDVATTNISSLNDSKAMIGRFMDLAGAFEFSSDGSLPPGVSAQTDANRSATNQRFVDGKGAFYFPEELNQALTSLFRASISKITSVDAFVSTPSVYDYALKAVGLDPQKVSPVTIKKVLESDPTDPKSYVNTLKDDRYVQLARAFNFDKNGNLRTPLVAQDSAEVLQIAKDYVIATVKFANPREQKDLRDKAQKDAEYYQKTIADIGSVSELLANRKMVNIILVANGLQPEKVSIEYLKKIFSSDLGDPKSFANTESDPRFAQIAASFNFGKDGKVALLETLGPQRRDQLLETQNNYLQQSLETQQGDENPGVRLALYFQRKAGHITSAYDILADKALSEVFRTTYNLPDTMAAMPIDQQAKVVEKYLNLKDLADPAKVEKLLSRFSAMYDMKNAGQDSLSLFGPLPGVSSGIFGSSLGAPGSSWGISESTFLAIATLGSRH